MRREPSFFGDRAELLYIAKRLRDALRLEGLLTGAGVDYGVEADEYRSGVLFRSVRAGAFFYVLEETAAAARQVLTSHGYRPYEAG